MRADLQSLDIHHLTVLSLLLQHCSVTKVAEKTGQAQPAISRNSIMRNFWKRQLV